MTHALIIDDTPTNSLVLSQLLVQENVSYCAVASVSELRLILNDLENIDLVFLDLELPQENGYEVLRHMKDLPKFHNTRFIAYSVHVSEMSVTLEVGFDAFLGKPLDAELFPQQLEAILRGEMVYHIP